MADSKEIMATGRRKCAIAVVKLVKGKGRIFINGKTLQAYIGNMPAVEMMIYRPLVLTENQDKYDVRVKAIGGGIVENVAYQKAIEVMQEKTSHIETYDLSNTVAAKLGMACGGTIKVLFEYIE